jgi:hypothetical protein
VVMPRERWTDERLDKAFARIGDLRELRVEMRKGFEQVDQRFEQVDQRFDYVDQRFDYFDQRFDYFDQRFDRLENRFGRVELWFASLCCTIIGGLLAGVIAVLSLH